MSHCVTIDQAILERTKMDKVLSKIVKRGDERGKAFAQKVLANAATVSKQKSLDSKVPQSSDGKDAGAKKAPAGPKTSLESSAGVRKPQTSGEIGSPLAKKGTAASSSTTSNSVAANAKGGNLAIRKPAGAEAKVADKGPPTAATGKVKTNVVVPKATSYFSSLQSASKKPGTSNAALKSSKPKDSKDGYVIRICTPVAFDIQRGSNLSIALHRRISLQIPPSQPRSRVSHLPRQWPILARPRNLHRQSLKRTGLPKHQRSEESA